MGRMVEMEEAELDIMRDLRDMIGECVGMLRERLRRD